MINRSFFTDECGDSNIISLIIITLIACLFFLLFSDYIFFYVEENVMSFIPSDIGTDIGNQMGIYPGSTTVIKYSSILHNLVLCLTVVWISVCDIIKHRIPNWGLFVLICNRTLFLFIEADNLIESLANSLSGCILPLLCIILFNIFVKHYRDILVFNAGDIKYILVTFYCVGVSGSAIVLLMIAVSLLITIILTIYRNIDYIQDRIPFAPYLSVGLLIHLFIEIIGK